MLRYLLDSNVASDPAKREPDSNVSRSLLLHTGEMAICAPVWHEMRYGLARMPGSRQRAIVADYLDRVAVQLPILPFDASAAQWYAAERARLEALGRPRAFVDGLIAAVAATRGLTLVTRNVRDFEGYQGLRVVNWFETGG